MSMFHLARLLWYIIHADRKDVQAHRTGEEEVVATEEDLLQEGIHHDGIPARDHRCPGLDDYLDHLLPGLDPRIM